jgi:hypothetical protein
MLVYEIEAQMGPIIIKSTGQKSHTTVPLSNKNWCTSSNVHEMSCNYILFCVFFYIKKWVFSAIFKLKVLSTTCLW